MIGPWQILAYMDGKETKEGIIRVVFGNTPDTSKALRMCDPAPHAAHDQIASPQTLSDAMRAVSSAMRLRGVEQAQE